MFRKKHLFLIFFLMTTTFHEACSAPYWVATYLMIRNNRPPNRTQAHNYRASYEESYSHYLQQQEEYFRNFSDHFKLFKDVLDYKKTKELKQKILKSLDLDHNCLYTFIAKRRKSVSYRNELNANSFLDQEDLSLIENLDQFYGGYFQLMAHWQHLPKDVYSSVHTNEIASAANNCHFLARRLRKNYKKIIKLLERDTESRL